MMAFIRKIKKWSKPSSFHWQNRFQSKLISRLSTWIRSKFTLSNVPEVYWSQFLYLIASYKVTGCLGMTYDKWSSTSINIWKIFHFLRKNTLLLSFTLLFCVEESITFISEEYCRAGGCRGKECDQPNLLYRSTMEKWSIQNPIPALNWKDSSNSWKTSKTMKIQGKQTALSSTPYLQQDLLHGS